MIVYSAVDRSSFENVKIKWLREVEEKSPNVPIILVATKIDLRDKSPSSIVTKEEGEDLAKTINAYSYMECSAFLHTGIQEVIDSALACHFNKKTTKPATEEGAAKDGCCILQ